MITSFFLQGGSESWFTESNVAIASLAFHPTAQLLLIATNNELHFWDWSRPEPFAVVKTGSDTERVRWVGQSGCGVSMKSELVRFRLYQQHSFHSTTEPCQASTFSTNGVKVPQMKYFRFLFMLDFDVLGFVDSGLATTSTQTCVFIVVYLSTCSFQVGEV